MTDIYSMNRKDFIAAIAATSGLTAHQSAVALKGMVQVIGEVTDQAGKVRINGFGVFSRRVRKARAGIHPVTGAAIQIPDRAALHFRPAKLNAVKGEAEA